MRIWHLVVAVFVCAMMMAIGRDDIGRVAIVVFFTAIGVVVLGVSAIMMLFRTIASFGAARSFFAHLEALIATAGVLVIGSGTMLAVMWFGASVVRVVVR